MSPVANGEDITGSSGQQSNSCPVDSWDHIGLTELGAKCYVDGTKLSQDQTPATFATAMEKV
jgi:hypothetical protein